MNLWWCTLLSTLVSAQSSQTIPPLTSSQSSRTASSLPSQSPAPGNQSGPTFSCDPAVQPSTYGVTRILSPFIYSWLHIGQAFNLSWTYINSDPAFPQTSVFLYYRPLSSQATWLPLGNVSAKTTSVNVTIPSSAIPGSYEYVVVPDNIDATQRLQVGRTVDCLPNGWPYPQTQSFSLLQPIDPAVFANPYPPNVSSDWGVVHAAHHRLALLLGLVLLLC
ncbi:hypothetical protein HDV03_000634 [Kappamyces sp. JEL0829]|nr:hypothetical protein HDV03_000634 [Kappamyces sp. JEL0829]